MSEEIPKKLPDAERIDPTQNIQPGEQKGPQPEEGKFASYMKEDSPQVESSQKPSPIDLAAQGKTTPLGPPTHDSVRLQMETASGSLGDIKNQLNTKNLKLKQSQKHLLRSKLQSSNEHIRGAAEQVGVQPGPPINLRTTRNPIAKYLAIVADGEHQLNNAAAQVKSITASGHDINPGALLRAQVQLQKAQQELDYTSVLLSKAVDVIKTLFQVQI